MRRIRQLLADRRGIAAVEFAVLAPVMILLIAGTIEAGQLMMIRTTLEGAVGEAARAAIADLALDEEDRDAAMRAYIGQRMSSYNMIDGGELEIETTVFRTFGSAYPEAYEDVNGNGRYDPPSESGPGEPFDDRNNNATRDLAVPVEGKLGGPGDVVSYTAVFPAKVYFGFLTSIFGQDGGFIVRASAVVRNEPVAKAATL